MQKTLGKFILSKRKLKKIPSRQLAIKCDISAAYMNDIEKDKRVPKCNATSKPSKAA